MLRLVRFPNLIIVVLTQYLLQYAILLPQLARFEQSAMLPNFEFFLLVCSTVLIAAGGYVVNDIEDMDIDRLNKPLKKQIVGRTIPLSIAWKIYWFLTILGFFISLYLAFYVHDLVQLLIYPAAVALLFAYSKWLKRLPLIGNLVVAFFCAFVAWVVFYAQKLHEPTLEEIQKGWRAAESYLLFVFGGYAVSAFLSTLFREIIKDIEDAEGDRTGDCLTLPIVIGVKKTKVIAFAVGVVLLEAVGFFSLILLKNDIQLFWNMGQNAVFKIAALNIIVSLPTLYTLFLLLKAKEKRDFARLSLLAKIIMLSGLAFILVMA